MGKENKEIAFVLRITKPLAGHVMAARKLERQGLDTLESKIEWAIRIEPAGDRLRIINGQPKIGNLRARLPEDAMNQLLIGRMFLASGVLDSRGKFRSAEGTSDSVSALQNSLASINFSQLQRDDVDQFLRNTLSESTIESTTAEHWKTMVESFVGKTMQIGETYETEAVTDMPVGGSVVFASQIKVVSQQPCGSEESQPNCVRIEWHSQPKESLVDLIQNSSTSYLPKGVSISQFDMTIDMVQEVNPATLVPISLTIVKTTKMEMRLPNGAIVPTHEVSTESWQYIWESSGL